MDMYSGRLVNSMVMLETTCGTTMETNSVMISAATMYAIRIESQRSLGFSFITYRCTGRTIQSST